MVTNPRHARCLRSGMFELAAFVMAIGSVLASVAWACKQDIAPQI